MICDKNSDSESYCDTQYNTNTVFAYDEDSSDLSEKDNLSEYSNYAIKDIKADFKWIDNEFEALAFDSLELSDEKTNEIDDKICEIDVFECGKGDKFDDNNN